MTSAFLFSLYIDDILLEISLQPYSCFLSINKINIEAYADDIVLSIVVAIVAEFTYLGCILNCNLLEKAELKIIMKSFNKIVGSFIRKFSSVDIAIKLKLFDTFCMSMHGLELFVNNKYSGDMLRKLGIAYLYTLKRLLGLPKFCSHHYTCSILAKFTFSHMNHKMLMFLFWCSESSSPCSMMHKTYFLNTLRLFPIISGVSMK